MNTAAVYAALDAGALAYRVDVLNLIWDAKSERVAGTLRAINWPGSKQAAIIHVDEGGRWSCVEHGACVRGKGFTALISHLAGVSEDTAAAHLRRLLASLRAIA